METKFVVATRFFEADQSKGAASLRRLLAFVQNALEVGASKVFVAINVDVDTSKALAHAWPENVVVLPVTPWGGFVMPLNALLLAARAELAAGAAFLTASVEVVFTSAGIAAMTGELDGQTLVVGAAMRGHEYERGVHHNARGRQVPWNTLSLWNPHLVWTTGFPLIGDGPLCYPDMRGVEELIGISTIQTLYPEVVVKLMVVPDQDWDVSSFNGERLAIHEKKMASKDTRPAAQLFAARLHGPTVVHV